MYGWNYILRVNLSNGRIYKEEIKKELALNFIGGRGINVKLLYDEVRPGIDPLGPDNKLILGVSPLTGILPGFTRFNATAKSPLTGILGDSNAGGQWAAEFRFAGYNHIVIEGASEKPVYIWIHDDHVEIRDAAYLWGKNVWETTELIREELGDEEIKVVAIGQAGENLVKYACLIADFARAAGRCGLGAVAGSKKLKAIAVRGTKGVKIAHPNQFEELWERWYECIKSINMGGLDYNIYGTPAITVPMHNGGFYPVKNFQSTQLTEEELENVSGETFVERYVVKSKACFPCLVHCAHYYRVAEGPYAGTAGEGLEFETINCFGPRCGNTYLPAILLANNLVNQYGLDVVETGAAIALAMHLYQEGLLDEEKTGGLKLEWGDHEVIIELIHLIAKREGIGNILAEGVVNIGKYIKGAEKYVIHSKGLSPVAWDCRAAKGVALGFATSTRGCDHLRGLWSISGYKAKLTEGLPDPSGLIPLKGKILIPNEYASEEKSRANIFLQHICAIRDMVEICTMHFASSWLQPPWPKDIAEALTIVTGVKFDEKDLFVCAERLWNLERAFNVREGITRKDDTFSPRYFEEPVPDGPYKGEVLHKEKFDEMLDKYYELRGWDVETGIPTRRKLEELGLKYVADELENLGKLPQ